MPVEKVVKLHDQSVSEQIQMFLDQKQMRSGSTQTRDAYYIDIRQFFRYFAKKELDFLKPTDLPLKLDSIVKYQIFLSRELGLVNKSINRKISTLKQLYAKLHRYGYVDDLSIDAFEEADRLKEGKNHHGVLSVDEIWKCVELIKTKPGLRKRMTQVGIILFAVDTCLRQSAILNLTWDDFIPNERDVEIKAIDKGNEEAKKRISREFYDLLLDLKKESTTDKVFDLSKTTINNMMQRLNEWMGIPKKRNIVFHSFRKTGVTFQYVISNNDIIQAMKAAGHKDVSTTMVYIDHDDYGNLGLVSSAGNIDNDLYKKVSHEELLKAIEMLDGSSKLRLNIKLKEIKG